MNDLAHRIKAARHQRGQSQADLAQKTRLTQQMISKLESGQSRSTSAIFAIANALCVSAEWLWLGGENPQTIAFFDDTPSLAKAWRNLTETQRSNITRQIMSLGQNPSAEEHPQDTSP
ncbi:helix-turn-helix domain-containing protein [Porticoccus sp.]